MKGKEGEVQRIIKMLKAQRTTEDKTLILLTYHTFLKQGYKNEKGNIKKDDNYNSIGNIIKY